MARSKISADDQQAIVHQYRTTEVTAGALAEQFTVSASTIARILKEGIPAKEYRALVSARKASSRRKADVKVADIAVDIEQDPGDLAREATLNPDWTPEDPMEEPLQLQLSQDEATDPSPEEDPEEVEEPDPQEAEDWDPADLGIQFEDAQDPQDAEEDEDDEEDFDEESVADELALEGIDEGDDDDDFEADDQDLEDLDGDDDDEDLVAPDEEEDDFEPDPAPTLEVLTLDELDYPAICYAVTDRFQELTTRPLKEFAALDTSVLQRAGIPEATIQSSRTLPIFDSHRVARRFSDLCKRDGGAPHRIIQFNGETLVAVSQHLKMKGITHLLVDGQIYSL